MAQTVKRLSTLRETRVRSLGREDPQEKEMQPTPVLLPGKSHGQGSLVGYSLWVLKDSDTTEGLHLHFLNLIKSTQRAELPLLLMGRNHKAGLGPTE